jgi:hypothetical protein
MNRLPTEKLKFPKINAGLIIEQISYRTEGIVVTKYLSSFPLFFTTDGGIAPRPNCQGPIKFFVLPPPFKKLYVSSHIYQLVGAIQFFHTINFFFLGGAVFPEGPRFKKRYNGEKNASIWRIFLVRPEGKMTRNKVIKDCAWRIKS